MLAASNMLALSFSRLAARTSARADGLATACFAAMFCVLGLVGAGFDYSVATAAAALEDPVIDAPDAMAWSNVIGNVLTGSLGIICAAALVLALSLWTAPNESMKVAPPQRQIYGEAD